MRLRLWFYSNGRTCRAVRGLKCIRISGERPVNSGRAAPFSNRFNCARTRLRAIVIGQ